MWATGRLDRGALQMNMKEPLQGVPEGILRPGTEVEVRDRFTGEWAPGFVIAEVDGGECLIERSRDGFVLPITFGTEDVRTPPTG
jgi:hypothetical protein